MRAGLLEHFDSGCGDYGDQAEAGIERGSEKEYLLDYRVSFTAKNVGKADDSPGNSDGDRGDGTIFEPPVVTDGPH